MTEPVTEHDAAPEPARATDAMGHLRGSSTAPVDVHAGALPAAAFQQR